MRVFQEQLERRFAERTAALRAANERLVDQVVHHRTPSRRMPHWAAITRFDDGRFLEVSDTFLRRFGYAREEVMGHTVHELGIWVTPEDRQRLLAQLVAHGAVRDFTFDVRTRNGEVRLVRLAGDLLGSGEERFILAVADDVTDAEARGARPV
jgi:PAS domain S-box-containing protein